MDLYGVYDVVRLRGAELIRAAERVRLGSQIRRFAAAGREGTR